LGNISNIHCPIQPNPRQLPKRTKGNWSTLLGLHHCCAVKSSRVKRPSSPVFRSPSAAGSGATSPHRARCPTHAKTSGRWCGSRASPSSPWLLPKRCVDVVFAAPRIPSLPGLRLFLCFLQESGREKSFRYWPRLGSRHNTVTYGRFKITTRFRTESGCYATTGLKIKHLLTGQERTVWHLQYIDWPDHGCPEDLKGFLSEWDLSFSGRPALLKQRGLVFCIRSNIKPPLCGGRGSFLCSGKTIGHRDVLELLVSAAESSVVMLLSQLTLRRSSR